jgi:hypothetical protein
MDCTGTVPIEAAMERLRVADHVRKALEALRAAARAKTELERNQLWALATTYLDAANTAFVVPTEVAAQMGRKAP